jgi:signal recognition particle subunit SRP54
MVLEELGQKLQDGVRQLFRNSSVIDEAALHRFLTTVSTSLLKADVDIHAVKELQETIRAQIRATQNTPGVNRQKIVNSALIHSLVRMLRPSAASPSGSTAGSMAASKSWILPMPSKTTPNIVILMVGLQGSGKTTSCVKLARYLHVRKNLSTALVCADTFRAGAFDQLKQNATQVKIPFYGTYNERDPCKVAEQGVEQFRKSGTQCIIVDSAGRHKQESALFEEMQQLVRVIQPHHVVFVMDSSIGQAAKTQALAFHRAVQIGSILLTKLDGHAKGGGALAAVSVTGAPISFIGTGEHMDQIEPFDAEVFVGRLLGMGDLSGLVQQLQESKVMEQAAQQPMYQQLLSAFGTGSGVGGGSASAATNKNAAVTFGAVKDQLQMILQLTSMGNWIDKIPRISNLFASMQPPQSSDRRSTAAAAAAAPSATTIQKSIRVYISLLDSMTGEELQWTDKTHRFFKEPSRAVRILRGSGTRNGAMFQGLLQMLTTMGKMFRGMMGMASGGGSPLNFGQKSHKNPQAQRQQFQNTFDPKMIHAMGGMQNMQNMLQKMEELEKTMPLPLPSRPSSTPSSPPERGSDGGDGHMHDPNGVD